MKKFATIASALALTAALSVPVFAQGGPGYGPGPGGPGYGPGMNPACANLTQEQKNDLAKAHADFMNETLALRQKVATKHVELKTLHAQVTPDQARIKAVSDELVDLKAQLAKKHNEFKAKNPCAVGFGRGKHGGMGRGMGHGPMGGGMGGGMMGGPAY